MLILSPKHKNRIGGTCKMDKTWIFQASPKRYNIDERWADPMPIMTWEVTQHAGEIDPGDGAIIWRAGRNAGVIGVATILSEPVRMYHPATYLKYAKNLTSAKGTLTLCVVLDIEKRGFLSKVAIRGIKELADLSIFKFPRRTVFPVSHPQAMRLLQQFAKCTSTAIGTQSEDRTGNPRR